jgi:hypothetical protein
MDLDKLAKERFLGLKIFPYIDEDFAAEEILKDTPYENDENLRRKIALRIEAAKMIGGSSGVLTRDFLKLFENFSICRLKLIERENHLRFVNENHFFFAL